MNKFFLAITILAASANASAALLVTKSSGGGYVPPEWMRSESCELHTDKVVITTYVGVGDGQSVSMVREEKVTLKGDVAILVANAGQEKEVRSPNNLCNAPSTVITGHIQNDRGFSLFETGGCGSERIERQGPASNALRMLVDKFCPTTYDYKR